MSSRGFNEVKFQFLATFAANIIVFGFGCNIGWYSPILPILVSDETPLSGGPLSISEVGWIACLPSLGAILGVLLFGLLAIKIGYRNSTLLTAIPITISWILIIFAQNSWYIMTARFLIGLSGGVFLTIPAFVSEIASDYIRGQLSSTIQTCFYSGIVTGYVCGAYMDYETNPLVLSTVPLIFLITFWFIPSSPQHLLKCNRIEEAESSLNFYRNAKNTDPATKSNVEEEFEKLKKIAKLNESEPILSVSDFCTPQAIRAFAVTMSLMFVCNLCGSYIMINYAATIFKETGSTIDPNISSICMGLVQICGNFSASKMIDRVGRKKLLVISNIGAGLSHAITGTYIYMGKNGYDVSAFNLLPVISISFFIFMVANGILPVPYVLVAEVMPQKIRKVGSTICNMASFAMSCTLLKCFPFMLVAFGLHGCILFFGCVVTVGLILTLTIVKETNGNNLDVIEE